MSKDVKALEGNNDRLPSPRLDKQGKLNGSLLNRGQGPWGYKDTATKRNDTS